MSEALTPTETRLSSSSPGAGPPAGSGAVTMRAASRNLLLSWCTCGREEGRVLGFGLGSRARGAGCEGSEALSGF
jgi:hypothetical protein